MEQYLIPKIDPKVFKLKRQEVVQNRPQQIQNEAKNLPIIVGAKAWPTIPQGIELYYQNIPFPRKGFPDSDILDALNIVKKDIIGWLLPFSNRKLVPMFLLFLLYPSLWKLEIINDFVLGIIRKSNYYLDFWVYEQKYFTPFANEVYYLVIIFLVKMGLKRNYAEQLGMIFCMFMEHDDRFRLPPQDLFNSTSREALLETPIKEINRLYKLLQEREEFAFTTQRIGSVFKILAIALYIPKVRKAFKFAIGAVDFEKLQFDEGDEYWACTWKNYNSMGLNLEEREKKREAWHKGMEPTPFIKLQ